MPKRFSLVVFAVTLLSSTSLYAQDLALKRVMLSSGGMGYFEYEADVEGDAHLKLTVVLDQVDDVLKSIVVYDDKGGVGGLDLPSREPLAQTFRNLPFVESDLGSSEGLLLALRGAEISVGGPHTLNGRIIGVVQEQETGADGQVTKDRHRVSVMSDKGLQSFILEDAENIQFSDPALQSQIDHALGALAANHMRDSRTLDLTTTGHEKRKVRVAYIVQTPLWKASYRIVLPADPSAKQATVQGWATVENLSGQDWKGVDLTLISGQPVTFRQGLYRTYLVDRPEAPVEVVGRLLPGIDQGAVAQHKADAGWGVNGGVRAALPTVPALAVNQAYGGADIAKLYRSSALAGPEGTITAQEGLTQVVFHLPASVSVENGRTLSAPIINNQMPVERLALYQPDVNAIHPLSTVKLTNDGKTGLPPGIVTIYENGDNGIAYVGDSRLSDLPVNDYRLLSYALDQTVTIAQNDEASSKSVRAAIANGVMRYNLINRKSVVYKVKSTEPRLLLVETPKFPGWTLTDPKTSDASEIQGKYRLPFNLKAEDGQQFSITQELVVTQREALTQTMDSDLLAYAENQEFDNKTREELRHIVDLRTDVAKADQRVRDIEASVNGIGQEQARIRQNLQSTPAGSDLQKRYLAKLNDQETLLDDLSEQRKQALQMDVNAKQALNDYISALN
ncbi:DUF4139 domain-containing protein [Methylovirgula sp. 4M-Z18]|uniref:DUF4139 domain-containing protein n=1 Tax=Methylovirgula sp. 4M-Z18 TaxID=2293567 RepID=UPI000E2EA81C|nr:DUF4139 domain-containing protein [Methylovirgula sp. 4M-Z18]RFB78204.1 DUF4139 domain-containing protein [Methylovirgula sp. 4M-Z18]